MITRREVETIQVTQDDSLGRLLDTMSSASVRLERKGQHYRLVRESAIDETPDAPPKEDTGTNYDPEKAREAWLGAVGILKGIDVEKFKAEIREQRGQDTIGRNDLEYKHPKWTE